MSTKTFLVLSCSVVVIVGGILAFISFDQHRRNTDDGRRDYSSHEDSAYVFLHAKVKMCDAIVVGKVVSEQIVQPDKSTPVGMHRELSIKTREILKGNDRDISGALIESIMTIRHSYTTSWKTVRGETHYTTTQFAPSWFDNDSTYVFMLDRCEGEAPEFRFRHSVQCCFFPITDEKKEEFRKAIDQMKADAITVSGLIDRIGDLNEKEFEQLVKLAGVNLDDPKAHAEEWRTWWTKNKQKFSVNDEVLKKFLQKENNVQDPAGNNGGK